LIPTFYPFYDFRSVCAWTERSERKMFWLTNTKSRQYCCCWADVLLFRRFPLTKATWLCYLTMPFDYTMLFHYTIPDFWWLYSVVGHWSGQKPINSLSSTNPIEWRKMVYNVMVWQNICSGFLKVNVKYTLAHCWAKAHTAQHTVYSFRQNSTREETSFRFSNLCKHIHAFYRRNLQKENW